MDKDEILARSRQESQKQDETERDTLVRAGLMACVVGGFVCAALIIIEAFFAQSVNMGAWAAFLSIAGTMLTV